MANFSKFEQGLISKGESDIAKTIISFMNISDLNPIANALGMQLTDVNEIMTAAKEIVSTSQSPEVFLVALRTKFAPAPSTTSGFPAWASPATPQQTPAAQIQATPMQQICVEDLRSMPDPQLKLTISGRMEASFARHGLRFQIFDVESVKKINNLVGEIRQVTEPVTSEDVDRMIDAQYAGIANYLAKKKEVSQALGGVRVGDETHKLLLALVGRKGFEGKAVGIASFAGQVAQMGWSDDIQSQAIKNGLVLGDLAVGYNYATGHPWTGLVPISLGENGQAVQSAAAPAATPAPAQQVVAHWAQQ